MNSEITITYQDKEYSAEYIIDDNMLTVFFEGSQIQTQIDGYRGKEESLAKQLLRNLVLRLG